MKYLRLVTKIIAIIILARGLFLAMGSILLSIDMINGAVEANPALYVRFLYYILLIAAAIGLLRSRLWGVYLLLALLLFDIFYWIILGYYQPLIKIALATEHMLAKIYGFAMIIWSRLLIPVALIVYFSLPVVRKDFVK